MNNSESDSDRMHITRREYCALIDIRGLQEKAHMMVMTARVESNGGYVLEGSSQAFSELTHDLSEEIDFKLSPRTSLRQLSKLYNRLCPDDFF